MTKGIRPDDDGLWRNDEVGVLRLFMLPRLRATRFQLTLPFFPNLLKKIGMTQSI